MRFQAMIVLYCFSLFYFPTDQTDFHRWLWINLRNLFDLREIIFKFELKPMDWFNFLSGLKPTLLNKQASKAIKTYIENPLIYRHHSLFPLLFTYISEIELFNRNYLNKTYIINRQKSLNLQT